MSTVFRARDEPVATRLDYWLHAVDQTFGPVSVRPPADARLPVQLVVGDVGAVRVAETTISRAISNERCQATRTPRLISRSDAEQYRIDVAVRGHMGVEQDGRRSSLQSGDFHLVDLSRPARWVSSAERWVAVTFPRALLPLRRDEVARLTAVRIPGDQGTGALVSSFARQLAGRLDDFGASDGARLGTTMVDLLTVALAARLDRDELASDGGQRALLPRVHAFIEERLADPELTPGAIAAAHHISVRYLYKLFELEGDSVAGWIRRRRLERCRRDLLDPALRARPVSAIGARWGITSPAHFTRLFRAAYGVPPSEYRLAVAEPADTR
jgi:AraC-like DNA-binding protein